MSQFFSLHSTLSALRHESQKNISKVEIFPFCWFMSRSIIGKFPSTKISRKSISRDLLAPAERATMNFTNETIRKKRCWLQPLIFSQWLTFIYMTLHSNASRMISRVIRYTNTRSILHRQAKNKSYRLSSQTYHSRDRWQEIQNALDHVKCVYFFMICTYWQLHIPLPSIRISADEVERFHRVVKCLLSLHEEQLDSIEVWSN